MKKVVVIIIVILVAAGAAGAYVVMKKDDKSNEKTTNKTSSSDQMEHDENYDESEEKTNAATNTIEIEDFAFSPATTTVKKGTTITWTNKDTAAHTVTPDEASDTFKGSESLGKGDTYSFTFDQAGTFKYHCQFHSSMKATVIVTE